MIPFFIFAHTLIQSASAAPAWDILTSLHGASTKPTATIQELISKPVELTGFTIIDEDKDGPISEFLFTQKPGTCVHDPLPSPNQIVYVKLPKGKSIPAFLNQKLKIKGMLRMSSRSDSAYELAVDSFTQL